MIKEKMKLAKELASQEDEPFKVVAYQIILNKLLDEISNPVTLESEQNQDMIKLNPELKLDFDFQQILNKIEVEKLNKIKNTKSILDKSLIILDHVNDIFPYNNGLTIEEIQKILIEKFGLTTITCASIRMALKRVTGQYLTRSETKDGKKMKYKYKILTLGKEYVKGLN